MDILEKLTYLVPPDSSYTCRYTHMHTDTYAHVYTRVINK